MTLRTNTTAADLTLSGMKAQLNKKKRPLKVAKKTKVEQTKKMKVSTDVKAKAKKAEKPKAVKILFDISEQDVAKALKFELKDTTIREKLRRVGGKDNVQLISMPERKELVLKVNNKAVCEIYPKTNGEFAFCTKEKYISQVKLDKNKKVEHHEKWDMTESFSLQKNELSGVLGQFAKCS